MAERSAEVDQMKGATLEQISDMVGEIGREFKSKQAQLNPLMAELKVNCVLTLNPFISEHQFRLTLMIEIKVIPSG